jgi:hypothetical protein
MNLTRGILIFLGAGSILFAGCPGTSSTSEKKLKRFRIVSTVGILTEDGIVLDKEVTSDKNGSLKIEAHGKRTVRLYEFGDIKVDNIRLIYRAQLKTKNLQGNVYLEMWVRVRGQGEYFSRALQAPLSGSTGWTSQKTAFILEKGQKSDNIKLNLVIDGEGTVWIDDILLIGSPLS